MNLEERNYVIIDFETANNYPSSVCQIGMVKVNKGKIVDTFQALIKPKPFYFNEVNISIHNISAGDVIDKPSFMDMYSIIDDFIDNHLLIAHNASFDMNCLLRILSFNNVEFSYNFVCSLRLAKDLISNCSHSLTNLSRDITKFNYKAHDALEDSLATQELMNYMYANYDLISHINDKYQIGSISNEKIYQGFICKKNKVNKNKVGYQLYLDI